MPMKFHRILLTAIAGLLLLPGFASADKIVRSIEKTFELDGVERIVVHTQGGSIKVVGDARSDAYVRVDQIFRNASEKEADELERDIDRAFEIQGDTLHVRFKRARSGWSDWSLFGSKPSVSFNIAIDTAKGIDVELRTSGGGIAVANLDGKVDAHTSGGGMEFHDIGGPLDAHTSGGNIEARRVKASAKLGTSGGRISVSSISGFAELTTSGGSISAEDLRGPLNAKSSGGSISASFTDGISSDTRLKTSGGSITAKLPAENSFYLDARTSGGGVRTEFPIALKGEIKRSAAEGPVNGGGPTLELKTSGGSIAVKYL